MHNYITYLTTCLPTYQLNYLSNYLHTHLYIYIIYIHIYIHHTSIYLPTYLPSYPHTHIHMPISHIYQYTCAYPVPLARPKLQFRGTILTFVNSGSPGISSRHPSSSARWIWNLLILYMAMTSRSRLTSATVWKLRQTSMCIPRWGNLGESLISPWGTLPGWTSESKRLNRLWTP